MAAPTHYELLGVQTHATPEEIKRRFRALAREHHPDVAGDRPETHERFVRISEAYQVLSDTNRRAAYDLMLRDRERLRQVAAYRRAAESAPRGARAADAEPPVETRSSQTARAHVQLEQMLRAAEAAYSLGRLRDATRLCRTILEQNRRFPDAYELLGDIYARQRRSDEAIQMYTMAAQLTPHNGLLMAKLNRLLTREGGVSPRAAAGRPATQRRARYGSMAAWQVLCGFGGAGIVLSNLFCFALIAPGRANLGLPLVEHWTPKLLLWLVLSGWVAGLTLAIAGIAGPLDQELLYPGRRRSGLPVGLLLAVTSAISFYLGAILYWILATAQESLSRTVVVMLVTTALLVAGYAGLSLTIWGNFEMAKEVLIFGGNAVFLSMLAGWFIGDIFRPLWA